MIELSVEKLPNIKKERGAMLKKMGIATLHDLLNHFPRKYEDRSHKKSIPLHKGWTSGTGPRSSSRPHTPCSHAIGKRHALHQSQAETDSRRVCRNCRKNKQRDSVS